MKEKEVTNAVKTYFEEKGYFSPKREFNIGVRPDVVAFRWKNEYEIEAFAVECKSTRKLRSLIETGLTQAREYQLAFPYVYLASPKLEEKPLEILKNTLSVLRMGLLSVDENSIVEEEMKASISPRLSYGEFLFKVRQRAVAILVYKEVVGDSFDINVQDSEEIHCYIKEAANFLLSNTGPRDNYYFGICIEKQENVKQTLGKIEAKHFHKLLTDLPEIKTIIW